MWGGWAVNEDRLILLLVLILGVLARNGLLVSAAGALLVLQHMRVPRRYFLLVEERGIELGLTLLLLAVLAPLASGRVGWDDMRQTLASPHGLAAVVGGLVAAVISAPGIELLRAQPQVIVGLMVGTILGVLCFRGTPVGPVAAAGIAAVLLRVLGRLR